MNTREERKRKDGNGKEKFMEARDSKETRENQWKEMTTTRTEAERESMRDGKIGVNERVMDNNGNNNAQ